MKLIAALAALCILATAAGAAAQSVPFDMSPERGPEAGPASPMVPPPGPTSTTPPAPQGGATAPIAPAPAGSSTIPTIPAQPSGEARRYLIPFRTLTLAGETDRRSWSIYLTAEQAAAPATLHLTYKNAIVVAPEISRLNIAINGVGLADEAIRSSEEFTDATVSVPPGLLKPGANTFTVQATMRHRTDCSIQSTYELWTEMDPAGTFISFASADAGQLRRMEDVAAIGVDPSGTTRFDFVVPAMDLAATTGPIMRLAQGLAMIANMPNQQIDIAQSVSGEAGPGRLEVIIGTPAELEALSIAAPQGAAISPVAAFVENPAAANAALVISGPTWPALETTIENIVAPVDRPPSQLRTVLSTSSWRLPDAPIFRERKELPFSELDVPTQEFSGRRFRTDFAFGVPSDFYAASYGEATILLDAAYSAEVKPGSHVDVYVNGNIAATVPITQAGGGILRQLPVGVTMRHFRPGANTIALEAVLLTEADAVCAPGATASDAARFVIFDTTRFVVPNFARTARRPDLAGIAGTGFPYSLAESPIALFASQSQPDAMSAAATMLAHMAVVAGRPIPVDGTVSPATANDRDAIFVGTISDMPPHLLSQLGVAPESRTAWGNGPAVDTGADDNAQTEATFNRWRQELSGRGWTGRVSQLEDWLFRNFGLTLGSLQLAPKAAPAYMPSGNIGLIVAQQASPSGTASWTLVAGPDGARLRDGMDVLGSELGWSRIGGQITMVDVDERTIETIPVSTFTFFETQPFSFGNYRLIVANWLSSNTLSFAATLFVLCLVLGLATAALLSTFGRQK